MTNVTFRFFFPVLLASEVVQGDDTTTNIRPDTTVIQRTPNAQSFALILPFFLPLRLRLSDVPLRVIRTKLLQNNARNTETSRSDHRFPRTVI